MKRSALFLSVLVCLSGCIPTGQDDVAPAELRTFQSEAEIARYFGTEYVGKFQLFETLFGYPFTPSQDALFLGKVSVRGPGDNATLQNPLGERVDQTDLVLTDGTYLYIARGDELHVVRAQPAEQIEAVGFVDLDWWSDALYLHGQDAIVVGGWTYSLQDHRNPPSDYEGVGPNHFYLQVVDVADPAHPVLHEKLEFAGQLLGSQKLGSKLVLLMASFPSPPLDKVTRRSIEQVMAGADFEPRWGRGLGILPDVEKSLVTWDRILHPANPTGWQVVSIVTVDLDHLDRDPQAVSVMGDFNDVYMTPSAVYLTNSDNHVHPRADTEVYKFELLDGVAQYVAAGRFEGRVHGYYLLDEMGDDLRVVATTGYGPSTPVGFEWLVNHVAVVRQNGQTLETVGRTADFQTPFAPAWAYYLGNVAFVENGYGGENYTTFDLVEPTQPRIVSAWLPGRFIAGVARLDADHVLALGGQPLAAQEASDGGTYVLVYDISDVASPSQVAEQLVGEPGSGMRSDQVSFAGGRLVVPIDMSEPPIDPSNISQIVWTGFYAYDVAVDGVTELGRMEMAGAYYSTEWLRGLFSGNTFYGVSNAVVKVASADDPGNVIKTIELPQ